MLAFVTSLEGEIAQGSSPPGRPVDPSPRQRTVPALVIAQTAGAGRWNMLEVPDQVDAMIERFLAISFRNRR